MTELTRRGLLRGAPAAVAGAGFAIDRAAKSLAGASAVQTGSGAMGQKNSGAVNTLAGLAEPRRDPHSHPSVKALEKQRRRREEAIEGRRMSRVLSGGCDPDIACLRSASPTTRSRMQRLRDEAERAAERSWGRMFRDTVTNAGREFGLPADWVPHLYDVEDEE